MNARPAVDAADREQRRLRKRRRLSIGLHTGTALLLAGLLVGMVNYLSFRHYRRADLSRMQYFALSAKTLNLLGHLEQDVRVLAFLERTFPGYDEIERLLQEYTETSPRVVVEWIEPDRNLARAEELARSYGVERRNVLVIVQDQAVEHIPAVQLYKREIEPGPGGLKTRRSAFLGEQKISSAIQTVTRNQRPRVCILQGHGEHEPDNFDKYAGYSDITTAMEGDNLEVLTLRFGEELQVPDDCDVLLIPGPKRRLSQPEIDLLGRYLDQSGRVMILLDSYTDTGFEPLLEDWGLRLRDDVVVDSSRTLSGRELFVTEYPSHPINSRLKGLSSVLYLPRSVEPALDAVPDGAGEVRRPQVRILATSSGAGWAETDPNQNPMQFNPARDYPGPVAVAAAVERGSVPGIDVELPPSRLVVFGDSDFVANGYVTGGNIDWFLSALNWLLEREESMGIAPRGVEDIRLALDRKALQRIVLVVVGVLPGAAALLALLVWITRRD